MIRGAPISNKKGHLICKKNNCSRRGFIDEHDRKTRVQIPNKKDIDTIVKALDYNAKVFYRHYELFSYMPLDTELDKELNIDKYMKYVPFSPHGIDEVKEFEKYITSILSKRFERHNNRPAKGKENIKIAHNSEFNGNTLYKIHNKLRKGDRKSAHRASVAFLYYSISFAALRDLYGMMEYYYGCPNPTNEKKEKDKAIAKCMIFVTSFTEYLLDNRHHISFDNAGQLMIDAVNYGPNAASTKNSSNWLICEKCFKNERLSLIENEKCPSCHSSRKKVSKVSPKSIQTMTHNAIVGTKFYKIHYPRFLGFLSEITEQIRNNDAVRTEYLACFKKYEKQIMKSEYSYLKKKCYRMIHYDKTERYKRKVCPANADDILNLTIEDEDYKNAIMDGVEKRGDPLLVGKLLEILSKYNYPKEFALQKTSRDIGIAISSFRFRNDPIAKRFFDRALLLAESRFHDCPF